MCDPILCIIVGLLVITVLKFVSYSVNSRWHKPQKIIYSGNVKIVIFVPTQTYILDDVRKAIAEAGAGRIGRYDYCSFTTTGTAQYRPLDGSDPYSGKVGEIERSTEYRLETVCNAKDVKKVIKAAKSVHPYEEMGYDIYPLLCIES
jgi:hypothetical protein